MEYDKGKLLELAFSKMCKSYNDMNLLKETLLMYEQKDKRSVCISKAAFEECDANIVKCVNEGNIKEALKYKSLAHDFAFFGAEDDFDMYMIACEWDREPSAKFWSPRRAILEGKHHLATLFNEFIEDENALFLSISLPPGTGKTTLIKFLTAFVVGKYPTSANMYVSYSDGMVKMMYDSVVSIVTDTSEYRHNDIFNNGTPLLSAEYSTISYRKKGDFPTIGITSLGGSVTGRTRANKFMITDDLVKNAEVARNHQRLETLYSDYQDTVTTRCIGDNVKQIMLGTIWSLYDPISRIEREHKDDPRYKFIKIPVWDENHESNFNYKHPDRYTTKKIEDIRKNIDEVTFNALYMQSPVERKGILFSENDMNWYNGELPGGDLIRKVAVCDVAWGGGDYLSMPFAYIYADGSVYIHDVIFNRGNKDVTQPIVIAKTKQHIPHSERYEANNGGHEYASAIDEKLRADGVRINITHKRAPSNQSKVSRIIQYSPDIKKWYFRSDKARGKEYENFMSNVLTFNQNGKNINDDAPDSLAMLADFITRGETKVEIDNRFW